MSYKHPTQVSAMFLREPEFGDGGPLDLETYPDDDAHELPRDTCWSCGEVMADVGMFHASCLCGTMPRGAPPRRHGRPGDGEHRDQEEHAEPGHSSSSGPEKRAASNLEKRWRPRRA